MKYAVNHHNHFNNVHVAFFVAMMQGLSSFMIEFTTILILTSITNTLDVIMRYVSLLAMTNIPRFYYSSLVDHKLLSVAGHQLTVINFRRDNQLRTSPCHIKVYRFIQKSMRLFFCCWSYYFMPFTSLAITYFMG